MKESQEIDNLNAAREILRSSIEKSRYVSTAVDETGSRMSQISRNLACLRSAVKSIGCGCEVYAIGAHVDRAIGPAAAVMKVLDLVYQLQDALKTGHPRAAGLFVYLANIKRLEEASKLLADNSRMVILWLEDVVHFVTNDTADRDDWYLVRVSKVMNILHELRGKGESCQVLSHAFHKLEAEYRHLLTQVGFSTPDPVVIQELRAITQVLAANNRFDKCMCIYAEARIETARAALESLELDYLDIELSELDSAQTVDNYIDQWDKHMEFSVRHLLHNEYRLCNEVFYREKFGSGDAWLECFAKIAMHCGFVEILKFGFTVCKSKNEAVKLLKLLKVFSTLDKLRLDFNDLFSGKCCSEIQNQTRDLVQRVVYGACEIFGEILVQVELQRAYSPPLDGSVPRLVHFLIEYCNELLEVENSSILVPVLEICQVWNNQAELGGEGLLTYEMHSIMRAVGTNLETWAKSYDDTALSCFFMMNNYWYLCNNIRGTKLGELMGDSWLESCEQSLEYYAALYMRESWEKLLVYLHEEGLTLFPGGRAIDRSIVKQRMSSFCEAFDDMYKKQSKWVACHKALRWKTCHLIVGAVVPPYKSYLHRYIPHEIADAGSCAKHSAESLEGLIGSLFQPKLGKYGSSNKCTELIGVTKNAAAAAFDHFSSTPAAA